jgi:tellurite resistance protein
MHDQNMAILKGLCAVAWADGRVADEEKEVIEALLEAFGASRSEAAEIRSYASSLKKLDDVPVSDLSYDDRRTLLQHAVLLTYIDGEQADSEKKMLDELCEVLSIPSAEASGIMTAASDRAKKLLSLLD